MDAMLEYLKALAARIIGRGGDPFRRPPDDLYSGVREPRKAGPGGRSSSAAVPEPAEPSVVRAAGTQGTQGT